jgi:FkbM family methyltransferase
MKSIGARVLQFRQWREGQRYRSVLRNGDAVYRQKCLIDGGSTENIIAELAFRDGTTLSATDGVSAAYVFYEVFLEDHYPKRMLRNAKIIVDIGANVGLFSYYARLQAPHSRIIAFEPDPATFSVLEKNVKPSSVQCFHNAVASFDGILEFYCSPVSVWSSVYSVMGAANGQMVKVPTVRLSQFIKQSGINHIDFLKIDVEGSEYDILLGDSELWSVATISCLAVETDRTPRDAKYQYKDMLQQLRSRFRIVEERKTQSSFPLLVCYLPRLVKGARDLKRQSHF